MRWLKVDLKSTFLALLGPKKKDGSLLLADRTEDIREYMLDELGAFGDKNYPAIMRRVRYAQDAQGLWYTRGEVMKVLSAAYGETVARDKMTTITDKFRGLLPPGLSSRPSSLTG